MAKLPKEQKVIGRIKPENEETQSAEGIAQSKDTEIEKTLKEAQEPNKDVEAPAGEIIPSNAAPDVTSAEGAAPSNLFKFTLDYDIIKGGKVVEKIKVEVAASTEETAHELGKIKAYEISKADPEKGDRAEYAQKFTKIKLGSE